RRLGDNSADAARKAAVGTAAAIRLISSQLADRVEEQVYARVAGFDDDEWTETDFNEAHGTLSEGDVAQLIADRQDGKEYPAAAGPIQSPLDPSQLAPVQVRLLLETFCKQAKTGTVRSDIIEYLRLAFGEYLSGRFATTDQALGVTLWPGRRSPR